MLGMRVSGVAESGDHEKPSAFRGSGRPVQWLPISGVVLKEEPSNAPQTFPGNFNVLQSTCRS